jgi:sugar lactone lactonase YvrE
MRILMSVIVAGVVATIVPAAAQIPATKPAEVFASGLSGPEGLAFAHDGSLLVGSTTGAIRRYRTNGTSTLFANVGERLAGLTLLRNRHILAAAFNTGNVWEIGPNGGSGRIFASGIGGPNFIVQTRREHIYVSSSTTGTILEITNGAPVVRASGLSFPNGMAIGRDSYLYVAETTAHRVSRMRMNRDGTLGIPEIYASGLPIVDGIALDRKMNLLAVGFGQLRVVEPRNLTPLTMPADPLFNWPSNLAFGNGRGFSRRDVFLANFGPQFGNGTNVIKLRYNHFGTRLIR